MNKYSQFVFNDYKNILEFNISFNDKYIIPAFSSLQSRIESSMISLAIAVKHSRYNIIVASSWV